MVEFGTKADTLEALRGHLTRSRVCPSAIFTVKEWSARPRDCIARIQKAFGGQPVIIRSSALNEDTHLTAMAGIYDSVLDVAADDESALRAAITQVVGSYERSPNEPHPQNQLLVQPMVRNISMSGVLFTKDLSTGGPYWVINYDDVSGKTDAITSGSGDTSRTLIIHHGSVDSLRSTRWRALTEAVLEIERLVACPGLDIEFAVTRAEEVNLLQVRRLVQKDTWDDALAQRVEASLQEIRRFLATRFRPVPGVLGRRSLLGVMPDWNPIEMIGAVPRRLGRSLYRYLITDSVWAEARAAMGYRDQSHRPLMISLAGRVYIDVRESFNSFLPASLPDEIGEKLVNHWLDALQAHPEYHDKVEFEVATTMYPCDFDARVRPALEEAGLGRDEVDRFASALLELTNRIIGGVPDIIATQQAKVARLQERRRNLLGTDGLAAVPDPLQAAAMLIDDCRVLGTPPFSILARCGFIAESCLRSLVTAGLLAPEAAQDFRRSIRTIVSEFLNAVDDYQAGRLSRAAFFADYGHLRPGTYDILSKRYDQRSDFQQPEAGAGSARRESRDEAARPDAAQMQRLERALRQRGYAFDAARLYDFMEGAIVGREYAKFRFTQNLSDGLELLAAWGAAQGLSRNDLSHIAITDLFNSFHESFPVPLEEHFRALAEAERARHVVGKSVRLPFLVADLADVDVIPLLKSRPNFVTRRKVRGRLVYLSGSEAAPASIQGAVVLIESADPGFDWIFANPIRGLITKYGGANSHMAIRCAELDLPAAIGCGEQLFDRLRSAPAVLLDCGAEFFTPAT